MSNKYTKNLTLCNSVIVVLTVYYYIEKKTTTQRSSHCLKQNNMDLVFLGLCVSSLCWCCIIISLSVNPVSAVLAPAWSSSAIPLLAG